MLHKRFDNSFDVLFPHRRNTSVSLKPHLIIVLILTLGKMMLRGGVGGQFLRNLN